jgi:hypothetical protein
MEEVTGEQVGRPAFPGSWLGFDGFGFGRYQVVSVGIRVIPIRSFRRVQFVDRDGWVC